MPAATVAADQSGSDCASGHRSGRPGPEGAGQAPAAQAHHSDHDPDDAAEALGTVAKVAARAMPSKKPVSAPAAAAAAMASEMFQREHGSGNELNALPINHQESVGQRQEPPGEVPEELGRGPGVSATAVAQLSALGDDAHSLQPAAQIATTARWAAPDTAAPPEEDNYDE